ncbi:MAG: ral secretion pathway protein [Gaiellaceae bacterium]|jgi:type II secretory ATPase GspE/PulE/Tfp pilus assembly ATPase PilB-like protein|nr:ral secretion pathway protein [Gaiellaceae bacterium]
MTAITPRSSELARARGLAERSGLDWIDLDAELIDPIAAKALSLSLMAEALAIPYAVDGRTLKVALADPRTREIVEQAADGPVEFVIASRAAVGNLIGSLRQARKHTGTLVAVDRLTEQAEGPDGVESGFLRRAAEAGATDLHFVPCENGLMVRARIDGVLRQIGHVDPAISQAAMQRLKVLSRLDVSENRRSQEGRMTLTTPAERLFDVRITTLPTVTGEGAALRILERTRQPPTLTEIGLSDELQLSLEHVLNKRRGALLVTGPTGSGKSTTIYAALADIARPEVNVVTVEDPVEYRLDGVYQLEVNPHVDLTFESALRSILRSDPDVVAVGEMRDLPTATTTLKAALTGSFVLSTLHTRDAPSAVTRLLDMGVEPYVTAATVAGVIAQRLVRRLCVHCREQYRATPAEAAELELVEDDAILFRAGGCDHCDRGYRGQIGLHQLMLIDDELKRIVLARGSYEDVANAAQAAGMRTLWEDGLTKALAGLTSIDELRRALVDVS